MKEKVPLFATMKVFLPVLFQRLTVLIENDAREAVFLQKMILKIFFALVQVWEKSFFDEIIILMNWFIFDQMVYFGEMIYVDEMIYFADMICVD